MQLFYLLNQVIHRFSQTSFTTPAYIVAKILKFTVMKLISIFSIVLLLGLTPPAQSQTEDNWEYKDLQVGEFTAVRLDGSFKVYLVQGEQSSIRVKASNNVVFDNIKVRNYNGELEIKLNQSIFEYSRVSLYITFKTLNQLDIEGGVNLKTNGYIDLNDFAVSIEGGANVELKLKAKTVEFRGAGGFILEMSGVADLLDLAIDGAGHVSANELKTDNVKFKVRGFGTGNVYATKLLNVKLEGVGMVRYKGEPKVTQYIDGLGSVKPQDK
jgi:hypothetical protein